MRKYKLTQTQEQNLNTIINLSGLKESIKEKVDKYIEQKTKELNRVSKKDKNSPNKYEDEEVRLVLAKSILIQLSDVEELLENYKEVNKNSFSSIKTFEQLYKEEKSNLEKEIRGKVKQRGKLQQKIDRISLMASKKVIAEEIFDRISDVKKEEKLKENLENQLLKLEQELKQIRGVNKIELLRNEEIPTNVTVKMSITSGSVIDDRIEELKLLQDYRENYEKYTQQTGKREHNRNIKELETILKTKRTVQENISKSFINEREDILKKVSQKIEALNKNKRMYIVEEVKTYCDIKPGHTKNYICETIKTNDNKEEFILSELEGVVTNKVVELSVGIIVANCNEKTSKIYTRKVNSSELLKIQRQSDKILKEIQDIKGLIN